MDTAYYVSNFSKQYNAKITCLHGVENPEVVEGR